MMTYRKFRIKHVVALFLVFALCLMPFSFSALAVDESVYLSSSGLSQQFSAWIAAALSAISISLDAINAPIADLANYIVDPFNVVYTYPEEQLYDYLDLNTISITPNGTVIDGVTYDDVWISTDAANKFRTNAFDFQSAYSIASNTNGTFASGSGFSFDLPFYSVGTQVRTVNYLFSHNRTAQSFSLGDLTLEFIPHSSGTGACNFYRNGSYLTMCNYKCNQDQSTLYIVGSNNNNVFRIFMDGKTSNTFPGDYLSDSFDFDFTSGTIPSDTPISGDDGLLIHVPHHSTSTHQDVSPFEDFLDDNPEFSEPGGVDIDIDLDPSITGKLDDLGAIIAPIINVIKSEIAPQPVTPVPPVEETIADTQYSILDQTLQNIRSDLSNIIQAISSIPSAISSLGDTILQDIENGPIKLFDKALDVISSIFAPVFALIRQGLSIWSYVVQWIGSLSAPLAFFFTVLPAAMWSPVYALIAGTICIAIYRRFGR